MRSLDETTLVAYVDGELDAATAREVEEALAEDKEAQALLEKLVASTGLVRSAFAAQLAEPVPEHLLDAVREPSASRPRSGSGPVPWWGRSISALAASIVLVAVGFGGGFLVFGGAPTETWGPAGQALAAQVIEGQKLFNGTLENEISGTSLAWRDAASGMGITVTPVKTYRRKQGGFCRDYRIERDTPNGKEIERGIACREGDGHWVTRYATIEVRDSSI